MTKERTMCRGQSKSLRAGEEKGTLVGVAETSGGLAECRRLHQKDLNLLGLPNTKGCSWQVRQSRLRPKEKNQSHLSRLPDRKIRGSQGEREQHLGEKERDQNGNMGWKESAPH